MSIVETMKQYIAHKGGQTSDVLVVSDGIRRLDELENSSNTPETEETDPEH